MMRGLLIAVVCLVLTPRVRGQAPLEVDPLVEVVEPELPRLHLSLDYLHFYLRGLRVPPLATTGPTGSQAVVGDPGTQILRGDGRLPSRHGRYIGIRAAAEYWFADDSAFGVDASVTILERDSSNITYKWFGVSPLARPYFDANDGRYKSEVIAGVNPIYGPVAGSLNLYSRMELFHEDTNLAYRLAHSENWRVSLLAGAHFIQFRERLDITSASRLLPAMTRVIGTEDHFQTFNKFYGGQVGMKGEATLGRWTFDAKGTLALGGDAQTIRAKGERIDDSPAGRIALPYGLYVLPSNSGNYERTALSFVTEWNANATFAVTPRIGLRAGYTLLTWTSPVRPGDQIQPINLNQLAGVGPAVPTIPFRSDPFWMQGLNLGIDFKY